MREINAPVRRVVHLYDCAVSYNYSAEMSLVDDK